MSSWQDEPIEFFHFRDKDGVEVDVVLERGAHELVGVEVKATATVTEADFKGLRKLQTAAGARTLPFGPSLYAVPLRALWERG